MFFFYLRYFYFIVWQITDIFGIVSIICSGGKESLMDEKKGSAI